MTQGHADTVDATFAAAQHDLATRLRHVADRLEQLPPLAAIDLLPILRDPVRAFLQTAEHLIARATWTAASR